MTSATSFGCLALDWWPDSKCDYTWCPWEGASFLNLDLTSKYLRNGIAALNGGGEIFLRLGGSLCDFVRYDFPGSHDGTCRDFSDPTNATRVGYELGSGCLRVDRWDELNGFCSDIEGCNLIFGVNALIGRTNETCPADVDCHNDAGSNPCCTTWSGNWNQSNAEALLRYTHDKGYKIYGYEFGNELAGSSGIQATNISPDVYSTDFCAFKNLVASIWSDGGDDIPKVISPDNNFDAAWYGDFVKMSFEKCGGADVITWHQYILGAGKDEAAAEKAMDSKVLDGQIHLGDTIMSTVADNTPSDVQGPEIWMGEAGGAYNSGRPGVTNAFMSSFWYLDGFGVLSEKGHQSFCRQTLVGGNYGLLQATGTNSYAPNPDFYALALWQNLMGRSVLEVERSDGVEGEGDRDLRVYAHCQKGGNGVSILALNLANDTSKVIDVTGVDGSQRFEYVMTAGDGIDGQQVLLNNALLEMNGSDFPDLTGAEWQQDGDGDNIGSITLEAQSYGFFVFEGVICNE
ncbi:hypothetical protein TrCOL_g13542 [Triparma columacea]|uniref:Glycoside hydrolase family 79 protein n=1 Tax=Triparma columacea TaxID=722753 RepID=A0A9W7LBK0_9STRA|nr:hypothetical protein TrCOL_g13542 [Triparma columacea]